MICCLGHSNSAGVALWYYVTGCLKSGYEILIRERSGEETKAFVSFSFFRTVRLACKLRRCSVFPENLPEILEDLRCAAPAARRLPLRAIAELPMSANAELLLPANAELPLPANAELHVALHAEQ